MVDSAEEGLIKELEPDEEREGTTELTTDTEDRRFVKRFTFIPISIAQETAPARSSEADENTSKLEIEPTPDQDKADTEDSSATQLMGSAR